MGVVIGNWYEMWVKDNRLSAVYAPSAISISSGVALYTVLGWAADSARNVKAEGKRFRLRLFGHGLPGYCQIGGGSGVATFSLKSGNKGGGPGLSIRDLQLFRMLHGLVDEIDLHGCFVACMGRSELEMRLPRNGIHVDGSVLNGIPAEDGNALCFQLAQVAGATVRASRDLQYLGVFADGAQTQFCMYDWSGTVVTWNPTGSIAEVKEYPLRKVELDSKYCLATQ
jgi:hypothetical protein